MKEQDKKIWAVSSKRPNLTQKTLNQSESFSENKKTSFLKT